MTSHISVVSLVTHFLVKSRILVQHCFKIYACKSVDFSNLRYPVHFSINWSLNQFRLKSSYFQLKVESTSKMLGFRWALLCDWPTKLTKPFQLDEKPKLPVTWSVWFSHASRSLLFRALNSHLFFVIVSYCLAFVALFKKQNCFTRVSLKKHFPCPIKNLFLSQVEIFNKNFCQTDESDLIISSVTKLIVDVREKTIFF